MLKDTFPTVLEFRQIPKAKDDGTKETPFYGVYQALATPILMHHPLILMVHEAQRWKVRRDPQRCNRPFASSVRVRALMSITPGLPRIGHQ